MSPEANPASILSEERRAEILRRMPDIPRDRMSLAEQDRADLLATLEEAELAAHNIEARLLAAHDRANDYKAQVRQVLRELWELPENRLDEVPLKVLQAAAALGLKLRD